jgi:hypothetical protein
MVSRGELVVLLLLGIVWVVVASWQLGPVAADLVRGEHVDRTRLFAIVLAALLPPVAFVLFIALRVAGQPSWRFATPVLLGAALCGLAAWQLDAEARPWMRTPPPTPTALPTATPGPGIGLPIPPSILTNVPIPIPTNLPIAIPTGLPIAIPTGLPVALPTNLPIQIPRLNEPTPQPGARLNPDEVRRLVRESIGQCLLLRGQLELARVSQEGGTWRLQPIIGGGVWMVDDATGRVTPDADAENRLSRECRDRPTPKPSG